MPRTADRRSPLTVLVVDDFPDGLDLVAEYLAFRGFTVLTATNGAEALTVVRERKPQVVLMDLSMPGVDGWEATRRIKADPATRDVIVIAVTAHALANESRRALDAGCDGFIAKPFDLAALADALPRFLTHGKSALNVAGLNQTAALRRPRRGSEPA